MIKIALCIPSLEMGGAERFVVDLARTIDKSEYCVQVVITRNAVKTPLWEILKENDIEIKDLSDKTFFKMTRKQIKYFRKEKPKVVHANVGAILHVMLAAKIARIPTKLYTVHNEAKLLFGESKIKKMIYKLAFTFFGFVPIAICNTVKQTIIDEFSISDKKVPVVKNGVDIKKFKKIYIDHKEIQIISVGTLYAIKNHQLLISAFSKLYKQYNNIKLVILGDGNQREVLEKKIDYLGIKSAVSMPGIKNNVADFLQESDIYVSTSLTEGLPLSILEAMACGLPVIATDAGGTVDIVKNGKNGIIIHKNNEDELCDALKILIDDLDKRRKFSEKSRSIAEDWSLENCAKGYERLYRK